MVDVGDEHDDHGEGVEAPLVGAVKVPPLQQHLQHNHHIVQGGDFLEPTVDSLRRDDT